MARFDFRQLSPDDPALAQALDVMRVAFAGMEGRIDPPSSLASMSLERLQQAAGAAEVWVAGDPVVGTVILTPKEQVLYVGKLAVSDPRQGLGRALMGLAEERAVALGFEWLELESRVELVEVHAVFKRLGFVEVMRTTHEGYVRPTSVVFRKKVVAG
ncbi:MAG: GNAT family N-acetyltransferase [Octadecabacter sp.]